MDAKATSLFITELRKQKGLTQKNLAELLKVTDKVVSRWETGKGLPETSLLKPLSDILGVSVSELLSGKIIEAEQMKDQTDKIIIESLDYSEADRDLRNILRYLLIGIVVALGGMFFALAMDSLFSGEESLSVGIGMYICILIVTCTGIVVPRLRKNKE